MLLKFLCKFCNVGLCVYKGVCYGLVDCDVIVGKVQWLLLVDEVMFWVVQVVLDVFGCVFGCKSVCCYLLIGLVGCGKCGNYLVGSYCIDGQVVYVCKVCYGVVILVDNIELILYYIVVEWLVMFDVVDLLCWEIYDVVEVEIICLELEIFYGELDRFVVECVEGLLIVCQVKISIDIVNVKIMKFQVC